MKSRGKAGHEPQPGKIGNGLVNLVEQLGEGRCAAVTMPECVVIDSLPEQRHLARAASGQLADFLNNIPRRAMHFRPARVRHDAICAELVAPARDAHVSLRRPVAGRDAA